MNMVLMDTDSSPVTPERSWYNVNLRMLWSSDEITRWVEHSRGYIHYIMCDGSRCDMATMAHMLATEIYAHRPDPDQADTARVTYNLSRFSRGSL